MAHKFYFAPRSYTELNSYTKKYYSQYNTMICKTCGLDIKVFTLNPDKLYLSYYEQQYKGKTCEEIIMEKVLS